MTVACFSHPSSFVLCGLRYSGSLACIVTRLLLCFMCMDGLLLHALFAHSIGASLLLLEGGSGDGALLRRAVTCKTSHYRCMHIFVFGGRHGSIDQHGSPAPTVTWNPGEEPAIMEMASPFLLYGFTSEYNGGGLRFLSEQSGSFPDSHSVPESARFRQSICL
jgi:hypothetical protein